jgi:hypothetical protein
LLSELRDPREAEQEPFTKPSEGPLTSFTRVSEASDRVRADGNGGGRPAAVSADGGGRPGAREGEGRKAASISLQVEEDEEEVVE